MTKLDHISENLRLIGGLSFAEYLVLPPQPLPDVPEPSYALLDFVTSKRDVQREPTAQQEPLGMLYEACHQAFPGANNILKFDYGGKQCTLTITRPSGIARTFKSDDTFIDKTAAKGQACERAIAFNAIDFIHYGDLKVDSTLSPLNGKEKDPDSQPQTIIQIIENACDAKNLTLKWVLFNGPTQPDSAARRANIARGNGAFLRVSSTPWTHHVYSCPSNYPSYGEAQLECARQAIRRGVLELTEVPEKVPLPSTELISLQHFYDSLPRPFPDPACEKTMVTDVDITSWFNHTLQSGSGTGVRAVPFLFAEGTLKGCLLRITRNGEETHSCVADARFSKTTEAKAAVKFLAMSEGLATWVAELTRAISELVTPAMRNNVQSISAGLDRDCRQLTGRIPELKTERAGSGAFSATLKVPVASDDTRTFVVPSQYGSKADARAAVYFQASQSDTMTFIAARLGRKRSDPPMEQEDGEVIEKPKKKKKKTHNNGSTNLSGGVQLGRVAGSSMPPRPSNSEYVHRHLHKPAPIHYPPQPYYLQPAPPLQYHGPQPFIPPHHNVYQSYPAYPPPPPPYPPHGYPPPLQWPNYGYGAPR